MRAIIKKSIIIVVDTVNFKCDEHEYWIMTKFLGITDMELYLTGRLTLPYELQCTKHMPVKWNDYYYIIENGVETTGIN